MVSSITARVNFSRSISSAPFDGRALHLGGQLLLRGGIERQQIERPEQRGRGGLVAGEDHGRDLVAELLVGEGLRRSRDRAPRPSGRTGRAAARPRSCRRRGARPSAWRRTRVQRLRKRARAKSCGLGQLSGSSRSRKCGRASRSPYSITKSRKAAPCAIHAEREHGAAGDLQRHPLHRPRADRPARCWRP